MQSTLWASQALTPDGWAGGVRIDIGADGRIAGVTPGTKAVGSRHEVLLPAPVNLHSHAFQRAMAGMTEARGPDAADSFWTWRRLMFRFLDHLSPNDVEAITAFAQMEMLEAGFAAVAEFHYLHHQPGGAPYADLGELAAKICAAASETGIGLTLLPVLYQYGGCDRRPLAAGQIRFGNDPERFAKLHDRARDLVKELPGDTGLGVAPHSLRAVSREGIAFAAGLDTKSPLHLHAAEQPAEVDEVKAVFGARPVEWLLANHEVDRRWCLIHATQMTPAETLGLAESGAVAGLCPITEASLGDGVFDGVRYFTAGGRIGIGTDSNIMISVASELRQLEYSQRLRDKARAVLATPQKSTGRNLYEAALAGGAQAAGRASGQIAPGYFADMIALDATAVDLDGRNGDEILDAWVFAANRNPVADVWSAGRHVVKQGFHCKRPGIEARYRAAMNSLRARI